MHPTQEILKVMESYKLHFLIAGDIQEFTT